MLPQDVRHHWSYDWRTNMGGSPHAHDHPGGHGVDLDKNMATGGSQHISDFELLLSIAVRSHPRVDSRAAATGLSGLAAVTAQMLRLRHTETVRLLANNLGYSVTDAHELVDENVDQLLACRAAAVREWRDVAELFDTSQLTAGEPPLSATQTISALSVSQLNIVAYANALRLTMAEALAELKAIAELEDAISA